VQCSNIKRPKGSFPLGNNLGFKKEKKTKNKKKKMEMLINLNLFILFIKFNIPLKNSFWQNKSYQKERQILILISLIEPDRDFSDSLEFNLTKYFPFLLL